MRIAKVLVLVLAVMLSGCGMNPPSPDNQSAGEMTDRGRGQVNTLDISGENQNGLTVLSDNYYQGAIGKTGADLKAALHEIISKQTKVSYETAKTALPETDEDPNKKNNLILLYTGRSQSKTSFGGSGDQWNREHVWPQSHFGNSPSIKSDLHNLKPADASVNACRAALDFDGDCSQTKKKNCDPENEAKNTCYDIDSWSPRPEVRGDIARILFYMAVRYEGDAGELNLELADKVKTSDLYMGKLSTLLKWNEDDPVDDFERRRNQVIFEKYQHNRNPFIDHPEWARQIWK